MILLSTGPSVERVVRTALLMLLIDGFAVAYLWDGYRGYARKNSHELLQLLGLADQPAPPIDSALTAAHAKQVTAETKPGEPTSNFTSKLGEPGLRHGDDAYYIGPGGWLRVASRDGRVVSIGWTNAGKTEADQKWQRWIGFALLAASALILVQLARVASSRLTLTDAGLQVGKRVSIPLAAITTVQPDPPGAPGCVDVRYVSDGGPTVLRLDPYIHRAIGPIVAELSRRRTLPHQD